jgi:pilus assembly protein CpaE
MGPPPLPTEIPSVTRPTPMDVLDQVLPPPPPVPPPEPKARITPSTVEFQPPPRRPGDGTIIAVMAGKGGSGKTVVAANLAVALGIRNDPERVAIVDADLQFGDVALLLQIDPVRTIDDLVGQMDSMSDERLDAALLRHESGLRVLPAPVLPVRDGDIGAKDVIEIVHRLRSMYDVVVVDTGPVFDDDLISILEFADHVVTVVDMDLPSVKNAKVALDRMRQIGFDMDSIRLVVNRANSKARLDLGELERSLGLRVGGSVPSDRLVPQSVNEGIPVIALSPRSKVARSFHALAEAFEMDERERLNSR